MFRRSTTVIEAADNYDLVALADLKADLGITATTDDAFLQRAISKASQAAAQYCRRVFPIETVQDRFECAAGEIELIASRFPITDITSIVEGTATLVADTDYQVDVQTGVLRRFRDGCAGARWCGSPVTIIYDAGFAEIPLDLQGAVTDMVKAQQFNRTRDPMLRSEDILSGLYAYTLFNAEQMPSGTADQVSSTLNNYRVQAVG